MWLVAGPFVHITAPGLPVGEFNPAASMVPVMFAMVPLVAIAEVMRAYLNARYRFVAPALMTVVLNGLAAAMIIVLPILGWKDIFLVAIAFVERRRRAAACSCARWRSGNGLRIRPALDLGDEQLRSVGKLCVRPLGAAGLNPVARVGEQLIVSFLPTGSISVLNYGFLVNSAVGGTVFFRSVIVALVPRLTDAHNLRRTGGGPARHRARRPHHARDQPAACGVDGGARQTCRGRRVRSRLVQAGVGRAPRQHPDRLLDQPCRAGDATRAARALLRAAGHANAAAQCVVRSSSPTWCCCPLLVLPFGLHNPSAIIGVALAYSLAQYVNAGHAWYRLTHTDGNPLRGVLPFASQVAHRVGVSALPR